MIQIPDVLLGQRARALESASCVETSYFGWGFICPDTECVVHGDGVSTPLKVIKKKLPAKPLAGCISFYGIFYIRCENGYLYEYDPSTSAVLRSFYVGGDGATWVSVSDNVCTSSLVTPIMYVLTQGVPGELVGIRLPDGAIFRSNMGFGDFKGGTIAATSATYGDTLQETTPSQVESPGVNPMGPLECVLVNSTGSICVVHFTPIGGFRHRAEYVDKIPATPLRLLKPFVSPAPMPPPPPVVPGVNYHNSVAFSVRRVVAYAGPCLRLRRSSDNAEKDIPFFKGWLDEGVALSFVGSGDGFVTAWYNQTPQYGIVKFIQPDAIKQPRLVTAGVIYKVGAAQRPCLRFDGTRWLRTETENVLKLLTAYGTTHVHCVTFMDSVYTNGGKTIFEQHERSGGYGFQSLSQDFRTDPFEYRNQMLKTALGYNGKTIDIKAQSGTDPDFPRPTVSNIFFGFASDANLSGSRLYWNGPSVGIGSKASTGLIPMATPEVFSRTFHSYLGCHRAQTYVVNFGIQEVMAQSISWPDQQTQDMLANQQGAFS